MEVLIGLLVGAVFFISTIKAYTVGLKHGKQLSNTNVPTLELNPIKAVQQHKQAAEIQKKIDTIEQGWNNIFAYDGTPQKEVKK